MTLLILWPDTPKQQTTDVRDCPQAEHPDHAETAVQLGDRVFVITSWDSSFTDNAGVCHATWCAYWRGTPPADETEYGSPHWLSIEHAVCVHDGSDRRMAIEAVAAQLEDRLANPPDNLTTRRYDAPEWEAELAQEVLDDPTKQVLLLPMADGAMARVITYRVYPSSNVWTARGVLVHGTGVHRDMTPVSVPQHMPYTEPHWAAQCVVDHLLPALVRTTFPSGIDVRQAGPALDMQVAQTMLLWTAGVCRPYFHNVQRVNDQCYVTRSATSGGAELFAPSTNAAHAMEVFTYLGKDMWGAVTLSFDGDCFDPPAYRVSVSGGGFAGVSTHAYGDTLHKAICRAFLLKAQVRHR